MIFKRISSICFALAFLLAIVVFGNVGVEYIPKSLARLGIVIFGAIALLMNLLSFRFDSDAESSNIVFWVGSVLIFVGLVLKMQHLAYDQFVLIAGILVVGISFFYNPFTKNDREKDDELLDQ